jgi:hypothetical protein
MKFRVAVTISVEVDVDTVGVQSMDTGVHKTVARRDAVEQVRHAVQRTGLPITGLAAGVAVPTERHEFDPEFRQGVQGIGPDAFFQGTQDAIPIETDARET